MCVLCVTEKNALNKKFLIQLTVYGVVLKSTVEQLYCTYVLYIYTVQYSTLLYRSAVQHAKTNICRDGWWLYSVHCAAVTPLVGWTRPTTARSPCCKSALQCIEQVFRTESSTPRNFENTNHHPHIDCTFLRNQSSGCGSWGQPGCWCRYADT